MRSKQPTVAPPPGSSVEDERVREIESQIAAHLINKYGPVLGLKPVSEVLGYATVDALERSLQRGHLVLRMLDLPHRRGGFVRAHDLAHHLATHASELSSQSSSKSGLRKERTSN